MKSRVLGITFVWVATLFVWSLGTCLAADTLQTPAPAKASDAKAVTQPVKTDAKAAAQPAKTVAQPAKTDAKAADAKAAAAKTDAKAAAKIAEPAMPLPPGEITIGAGFGDQMFESFGDVLLPVWAYKSGIVFINPRGSANDANEQECNLGLGARYLIPKKDIILGANVYYDSRWTAHDNQFDELGVGVELLSKWVDARANYYFGDDSKKVAETRVETKKWDTSSTSTSYSDPYGEGNSIVQDQVVTTTKTSWTEKQTFQNFETGMEGWDAEIGAKLPVLEKLAETRVFVGYERFDNPFGDDLKGLTARVEVRALPGLTLDGKYYEEKDLNGTQYYIGGRVQVPFDVGNLAKGKNPFAGTLDQFKPGVKPFASRLTEMVIRDMHIQMSESEFSEVTSKRDLSSQSKVVAKKTTNLVVTNGIAFVDGDNQGFENGTFEHPYDRIQEGVTRAALDPNIDITYVENVTQVGDRYNENVIVLPGVTVWGAGTAIQGYGGRSFGGGTKPIADGNGFGPTFRLMNDTRLTGMDIRNTPDQDHPFLGVVNPLNFILVPPGSANSGVTDPTLYYVGNAGIVAQGANHYQIDNNYVSCSGFGAVLIAPMLGDGTFRPVVEGNTFENNLFGGAVIEGRGFGDGAFNPVVKDNTFCLNSGVNETYANYVYNQTGFDLMQVGGYGLLVRGTDYATADIYTANNTATLNRKTGMDLLAHTVGGDATIEMWGDTARANGLPSIIPFLGGPGDGISAEARSENSGSANVNIYNALSSFNENDGIVAVADTTGSGSANVYLSGNTVRGNLGMGTGIDAASTTWGSGSATIQVYGNTATANNGGGISVDAQALGTGAASIYVGNNDATLNNGIGIEALSYAANYQAYADVYRNTARANLDNGIGVRVDAPNYYASAYLSDNTVTLNAGNGIWAQIKGVYAYLSSGGHTLVAGNAADGVLATVNSTSSAAQGWLSGITAIGNIGSGVDLDVVSANYEAQGAIYDSEASLNIGTGFQLTVAAPNYYGYGYLGGLTARGNDGPGVTLNVNAWAANAYLNNYGDNTLRFNDGPGLVAAINGTYSAYSTGGATATANNGPGAVITVTGGTVADADFYGTYNLNNGDGLVATVSSGSSSASADFYGVNAAGNANDGIRASIASASGPASAWFSGGTQAGNLGSGIHVDVLANGGADATLTIEGARETLNGNDGILAKAQSAGGNAYGTISNVTAVGNFGDGIDVDVTAGGSGNATLNVTDGMASLNAANGILADVLATGTGEASATFTGGASSLNGKNGIEVNVTDSATPSPATLTVTDWNALGNLGNGIDADVTALGQNGAAVATFNGVVASANGGNGARVNVSAQNGGNASASFSGGAYDANLGLNAEGNGIAVNVSAIGLGTASLSLSDLSASGQLNGNGVLASVSAFDGGATMTMNGVVALLNTYDGVDADVTGNGLGNATLNVNGGTFSLNADNGILADVVALGSGEATATFTGGASSLNGQNGIEVNVTDSAVPAPASLTVTDWSALGNRGNGIDADVTSLSSGGAAVATFDRVLARLNGQNGINLSVTATNAAAATFSHTRVSANEQAGILASVNGGASADLTVNRAIGLFNGGPYDLDATVTSPVRTITLTNNMFGATQILP